MFVALVIKLIHFFLAVWQIIRKEWRKEENKVDLLER